MLNSPAITELTVESGTYRLLNEWLAQWFDGAGHVVGTNGALVFPKVNRGFGVSAAAQPLHTFGEGLDAEIRVLMFSRGEHFLYANTALYQGKLMQDRVTLNFWCNAKKPGEGQSEKLAQTIGDRVKAIVTNPDARYDLALKGITTMQPQGPAMWVPSAEYARRMVAVNAELQYAVQYGTEPVVSVELPSQLSGATAQVNFAREAPLLPGTYLLGYYQWGHAVKCTGVRVSAWPPQGADVVLELEVNGVLTGATVRLAAGVANQETVTTGSLNVDVPASRGVRWKVTSAPDAEFTAWGCGLAMEVRAT